MAKLSIKGWHNNGKYWGLRVLSSNLERLFKEMRDITGISPHAVGICSNRRPKVDANKKTQSKT
jgi:hypothetical protein